MPTLPAVIVTLLLPFERLFDPRTWRKAQLLVVGAILSPGKRTVSSALNILGIGQHGDFAIYHHVLNRAQWSPLRLSRVLLLLVAGRLGSSNEPLVFGIDETVERRWGRKIAAKGRYRDAVRSTDDQVVMTPGLQWVSLMLLTRIGWAGRHWALPFLTALATSARYDRRKGRRHKMVTDYAQQMLVCLRRWLPERDLVVVCDGGYAKREFLLHCQSMSKPIVVITKLRKDASLYQPAPPRRPGQIGRPRVVGARLPSPTAVLDDPATQWTPGRATGSDGSVAMVELTSGVALWYRGGYPSVHMRWVVVRHLEEPLGPYALLCTDSEADPLRILQWYMLRWQVEVTFEELRAHLGMETQRQWSERAIARTTPALFGLFSVVTLAADILTGQQGGMAPRTTAWYDKTSPSFADAIALVRRHLWVQQGTSMPSEREHESIKVPRLLYHRMLDSLSYAA
jgi:hypothetical protein